MALATRTLEILQATICLHKHDTINNLKNEPGSLGEAGHLGVAYCNALMIENQYKPLYLYQSRQ